MSCVDFSSLTAVAASVSDALSTLTMTRELLVPLGSELRVLEVAELGSRTQATTVVEDRAR